MVALLGAFLVVADRSANPLMLHDTDTAVLLQTIRARHDPLSWFVGDWPLQNHFYRPISTLAFELDNRLYGSAASGYGLTNALLCALSVLLLFWFVRELTDLPVLSAGSAALFALWTAGSTSLAISCVSLLGLACLAGGLWRHQLRIGWYLPGYFVFAFAASELHGIRPLEARMLDWLPGRTASVMCVFALIAMAAYARYERTSAKRLVAAPGPLDPPATRNTVRAREPSKFSFLWAVGALLACAAALGSYEQAVMLPACVLGVAIVQRLRGYKVRWGWQLGFWSLLAAYLVLRSRLIPVMPSHYQLQQFRHGPGVYLSLTEFLLPAFGSYPAFIQTFDEGFLLLLNPQLWSIVHASVANAVAYYQLRRHWVLALAGWALSVVSFLPMAWLKEFEHYFYWPMAMRSLFVCVLIWVGLDLLIIAWSRPGLQAPARPSAAPGSLPHP